MSDQYKKYTSAFNWTDHGKKCFCDGCQFLNTKLGHAILEYAISFIKEITETVKQGKAEPGDQLFVEFNGPDSSMPNPLAPGRTGKAYSSFNGTVQEVADMRQLKAVQKPDLDVLEEAYANDPVVLQLLEWIKNA